MNKHVFLNLCSFELNRTFNFCYEHTYEYEIGYIIIYLGGKSYEHSINKG